VRNGTFQKIADDFLQVLSVHTYLQVLGRRSAKVINTATGVFKA
jgi:hypothetical protein